MIDDDAPLHVCFTREFRFVPDPYTTIVYAPGVVEVTDDCAIRAVEAGASHYCDANGLPVHIVFEGDAEDEA